MPAKVNRRIDTAEEIAALAARVTKLESFPPNGITLITHASGAGGVTITQASDAVLDVATTASFTTIRPVPLLIIGQTAVGTDGNFVLTEGVIHAALVIPGVGTYA